MKRASVGSAGASATVDVGPLFPASPLIGESPPSALEKAVRRWRLRALPRPSPIRFIQAYYLLHAAAVLAYVPMRAWVAPLLNQKIPAWEWNAESRENQMFAILFVLLFTKYRRSNTFETFLTSYAIKYTKLAVLGAAYVVDYRLAGWFVLIFGILMLVGPREPAYTGPTHVREVTAAYFKTSIDSALADATITYIVQLYSPSTEACACFESEFARLSLHYGYPRSGVVFININVDDHSDIASQFQALTPAQNRYEHELPTLLMFQGGKLQARLQSRLDGKATMMDEFNIARGMDLERRARINPEVLAELAAGLKPSKKCTTTAAPTKAKSK